MNRPGKILTYLENVRQSKGAGYLVLIDPDGMSDQSLEERIEAINESEVDAILVGGSLMMDGKNHERTVLIKKNAKVPVIFFPGGVSQLNEHYDAVLFMSVLSGRNPHYLIGEQVIAAPIIKDLGIETIATAYLLLDGNAHSTVEFMSGTRPIPMNRPEITVAHALAAQYLGMQMVYLEAGSGATIPVSDDNVKWVCSQINIPVIVGGGLREPEVAARKVAAGASFIVTGTIIEEKGDEKLLREFSRAIHRRN
jgi:phosphoglycerol geranylgeranyltransferase